MESVRTGFRDLARSGGPGSAAASEAQLAKCFDEPLKKAAATATAVKASIDQAIGVRDEASGSSAAKPEKEKEKVSEKR
jgi:hypothetical protein